MAETPTSLASPVASVYSVPSEDRSVRFWTSAGAAIAAPRSARTSQIRRRRLTSCPQVDHPHQADLPEIVLERREVGIEPGEGVVLGVGLRFESHLRIGFREEVVRVLDHVVAPEFLAEREGLAAPARRLVEAVALDAGEAEIEHWRVHRLARPEV